MMASNCRSEEHTSELQSLRHLVCRLLLEKKTCHPAARGVDAPPEGRTRRWSMARAMGSSDGGEERRKRLGQWTLRRQNTSPFFFNDPATTEIYTLSLHDALPILSEELKGAGAANGFFQTLSENSSALLECINSERSFGMNNRLPDFSQVAFPSAQA